MTLRPLPFILLTTVFLSSAPARAGATEGDAGKWEVAVAHAPSKEVSLDLDEGTWINLDVSPDGGVIAFDLLGDIYSMPIGGGEAVLLTGGPAWDMHPRFSPDGRHISFISDGGGADNVWVMDADGANRRAVTTETFRTLASPDWMPDGRFIFARKHFTGTRSLGAGEVWLFAAEGGKGIQLTRKETDTSDLNEPAISPDGRWLYYSHSGPFDYNKDVNDGIFQISRIDLERGDVEPVTRTYGGAVRPTPSPDGRSLAFVRRVRTHSVLFVRDLETGAERPLFDGLDKDQMETWAIHGLYPSFSWTPDSSAIIASWGGKIGRIEVASGATATIPFTAAVKQTIEDAVRPTIPVGGEMLTSRMIRWPTLSPDRRRLLFQAVGHIYVLDLESGEGNIGPRRLTTDEELEYAPAWSPDGRRIAFVTWNEQEGGHLWSVPATGGTPTRLTQVADQYANPSWSRDGRRIVLVRGSGAARRLDEALGGELFLRIVWIDAQGGPAHTMIRTPNPGSNDRMPRPTYNSDDTRVFYAEVVGEGDDAGLGLVSVALDGTDKRVHAKGKRARDIAVSPEEAHLAYKDLQQIYLIPLPPTGPGPISLDPDGAGLPAPRLSRIGGDWPWFSTDGEEVIWSLGATVYRTPVAAALQSTLAGETEDEKKEEESTDGDGTDLKESPQEPIDNPAIAETLMHEILLEVPRAVPDGRVALKGARLVTMKGDEVIEDGTIMVEGERIVALGPSLQVVIPEGTEVIDVGGRTIVPGLIDVHAHMHYSALDINPLADWQYYANLAYGVTTTHDPSASTHAVFSQAEMVEAGLMTGPRIYSTGFILYGAENTDKAVIESLEEARAHVKRLKAQGAISVKSYNQPRREQRQWIIEAAREEEMLVVPEGGSTLATNLSMILDGHSGIEHSLPVTPLYRDILTLMGRSKTGYTPTLIVAYGGIMGENYWYQHTDVWKDERLLRFVPRAVVDSRARRPILMASDDDWGHIAIARGAKALLDAGASVQLGAHGQLQGLGAHWELWMFAQGGMSPMEALRCGTLNGARYLGMGDDLGSLEPGKLADLVVLADNPLDDLRNSTSLQKVMKGGYLYDAWTMNMIWPQAQERPPLGFEAAGTP
jgi:Tol biopolymer transport system component/imidazolonepropionase-like amidohydrolase